MACPSTYDKLIAKVLLTESEVKKYQRNSNQNTIKKDQQLGIWLNIRGYTTTLAAAATAFSGLLREHPISIPFSI